MADGNDHGRFRAMRVDELKHFLTQRGIPCSEKKNDELVDKAARAEGKYEPQDACDQEESKKKEASHRRE